MLMSIKRMSLIALLALCAGVILMSLSGMVNVGQGGLVLGFAAEPAKFE